MSTGVGIMIFLRDMTVFSFLHRIYMRIKSYFFFSIRYPPGPSGTAAGGKGLQHSFVRANKTFTSKS